jgi:hypothetical protein
MRGSICVNSKGRAHEHERKGSSGKPSFRFVNAVPENEEWTNLRSVVRANATQYKLRLSRVARTGPAVAPTAAEQVHCNKGVAGHEHKAFYEFLHVDREATFSLDGFDSAEEVLNTGQLQNHRHRHPLRTITTPPA